MRRKSQANEERKIIAEEQWLEDYIGLLSNYYISLMQVRTSLIRHCTVRIFTLISLCRLNGTDFRIPTCISRTIMVLWKVSEIIKQ